MAEKLSDKLKTLFRRADTSLGKGVDKVGSLKIPKIKDLFSKTRGAPPAGAYPKMSEFKAFKAGQSFAGKKTPSSSKALVTAKKAKQLRNISKLKTAGRILTKGAVPLTVGFEVANIGYQLATRTPEQKARTKALKAKLKKTSTKDYHSDLLKMKVGGDTMLKKIPEGPKGEGLRKLKAERPDVTKKMGFAKKGKMLKARVGRSVETAGSKMAKNQNMRRTLIAKLRGAQIGPSEESELKGMTNQDLRDKLKEKKMLKADKGKMMNFKEFVKKESGAQVGPNELDNLRKKYLKKIRAAQVGPAEEMKLMGGKMDKMKDMKMFSGGAKKGKMLKAKSGDMAKINKVVKGLNKASKLHQAQAKSLKTIKASKGKNADIDLIEKIVKQPIVGTGMLTQMKGAAKSAKKKRIGGMSYANVGMAAKKVREKEMMKASEGKSVRGYGAARTSGMGLQDEQLIPGKSLDYYKDLM